MTIFKPYTMHYSDTYLWMTILCSFSLQWNHVNTTTLRPWKVGRINAKFFSTYFQNLTFETHNSKILGAYDKNCWFYKRAKLSYFTFKNGQETGIKFIVLWRQFVCSGLFTPCHRGEIQRKRKYQVILNRIVSPIYWEFLMKILWSQIRKMLKNP